MAKKKQINKNERKKQKHKRRQNENASREYKNVWEVITHSPTPTLCLSYSHSSLYNVSLASLKCFLPDRAFFCCFLCPLFGSLCVGGGPFVYGSLWELTHVIKIKSGSQASTPSLSPRNFKSVASRHPEMES